MIQKYYNYLEWEDLKNGMYETTCDNEEEIIEMSISLLSNSKKFSKVLSKVYQEWKISIQVNLSNKSCNRQAWLGQSACSYNHKGTELTTRKAWSMLSNIKRFEANRIADIYIRKYERENTGLYNNMGETLL